VVVVVEHAADVDRHAIAEERESARGVGIGDARIRNGFVTMPLTIAGRTQRIGASVGAPGLPAIPYVKSLFASPKSRIPSVCTSAERERTVIADRVTILQRAEVVVLRFVIVGRGGSPRRRRSESGRFGMRD